MSRRPHGRAIVDPDKPSAFGICDGCGFLYNLVDLNYQMQVAGPTIINTHMRKCWQCTDDLQWNLQTIILPPDPMPILDPRVENFAVDEIDYLAASDGDHIQTDEEQPMVTNQPSENFQDV